MPDKKSPSTNDAAAAIDDVLVAETAAKQAIEACRKEAEAIVEAAREDARRIGRLANARVSKIHARCDELVAEKIRQVRETAREEAVRTELNDADRKLLSQAVESLAVRLTRPGDG